MQIVKRDGRKKDFDAIRIREAIHKAYLDVSNEERFQEEYNFLEPMILTDIEKQNKEEFKIEEIQNIIINNLKRINDDVASSYQDYRFQRSIEREKSTDTYKKIHKIIQCNDILNSNANVDEHSFGGRKFESAGVVMKNFALYSIMKPEFTKAHLANLIYQHDLDSYAVGLHNCSFVDARKLVNETGFETRNGDVRHSNSLSTAFQQIAVIFQIQSQEQFGGTASGHIDYDLEPQVNIAFRKHFADALYYFSDKFNNDTDEFSQDYFQAKISEGVDYKTLEEEINIENIDDLYKKYPKEMKMAMRELEKEGSQAGQGLYHNLNTLESRPGSQVPFTSINFGRRTTVAGRLICKWLLNASLEGIGKFHRTSIFPISIFQYKKGVNAHKGDPNYDEKLKVIDSLCHRIYPNIVNGDWSQNIDDPNNPDTFMMTMGCVDGQEIITYKLKNKLYVESFERMWNRLSNKFEVKEQEAKDNYYIDLKNVSIFDTKNGFVDTKRIIKNKDKGDWTRIKFSNGRSLLATSDHPLPIINKGRTFVKDLNIGDKININQKQYSEESILYDSDKAWLLGFLLCDGCYDDQVSSSIALTGEDDIEENYKRIFKELYNLDVKTVVWNRGKRGDYKELKIGTEKYEDYKKIQSELLETFGGLQKIYRQIPSEIFSWNRSAKLSFLAGMIDADGYINSTGHCGSTVQIGSTNKELALQTMALAQSLGLPTKVYLNHYTSKDKNKIRYRVEFSATIELLKYMACHKKIDCFTREANIALTNEATVTSIELLGNINNFSYDVTTESDHFEVSGIYSHNCRTLIGFDRNGMGYIKIGRGNVAPATINLIKLGIKHGICLGKRQKADLKGFWKEYDKVIDLCAESLKFRFDYICSQSSSSAPFMYKNKSMRGGEFERDDCVYEVMKHSTLAMGYIGVAEMCQALFAKDHADGDEFVYNFALEVVKHLYDKAKEYSDKYNLNFGCYASPAESTCGTVITGNREIKGLREEYGIIPNVTSHDWATNSHHVPVWKKVDVFTKLKLEAPFTKYATSGCITYIELDSGIMKNPKAIEELIDYAMDLDIPYLAFNFPIDTCLDCGYQSEFNNNCSMCGSDHIEQLRRVTGYLTTDYRKFNHAKQEEVQARFKHSTITKL